MMTPLPPSSSRVLPPPPPPTPMVHMEHISQLQTAVTTMQMMSAMGASVGPDAALHLANNALGLVLSMQQQHTQHASQLSQYVAAQCATTTHMVQQAMQTALPPPPPPPEEVVIELVSPRLRQQQARVACMLCICFAMHAHALHLLCNTCTCFASAFQCMHKSIMHTSMHMAYTHASAMRMPACERTYGCIHFNLLIP